MKLDERFNCKYTGIYKIENLITHEIYIGQAKNICSRIAQHLHSSTSELRSDYNYPLHKAFRQYGIDNFDLEVLERCIPKQLNTAEMYWIKKYDAYNSGYNQTKGGYQSIRYIKLTSKQVLAIYKLLENTSLSYAEIGTQFNVSRDLIYRIDIGINWHDDNIIYPIRKEKIVDLYKLYQYDGTCIYQINKNTGEVINKFTSPGLASLILFKDRKHKGHIQEVINHNRASAWGYYWERVEISKEEWYDLLKKYVDDTGQLKADNE